MTPEERAEKLLDDLIGYATTAGHPPGRENDPNRWTPRENAGESYSVILTAIREAVAAEGKKP